MKKRVLIISLVIALFFSIVFYYNNSFAATSIDEILNDTNLKGIPEGESGLSTTDGVVGALNSIIGLLQFAGSGISIIAVTILGMKYIIASPSEKADVKKSIMPILIGCALLFGGVNLAAVILSVSQKVWE